MCAYVPGDVRLMCAVSCACLCFAQVCSCLAGVAFWIQFAHRCNFTMDSAELSANIAVVLAQQAKLAELTKGLLEAVQVGKHSEQAPSASKVEMPVELPAIPVEKASGEPVVIIIDDESCDESDDANCVASLGAHGDKFRSPLLEPLEIPMPVLVPMVGANFGAKSPDPGSPTEPSEPALPHTAAEAEQAQAEAATEEAQAEKAELPHAEAGTEQVDAAKEFKPAVGITGGVYRVRR